MDRHSLSGMKPALTLSSKIMERGKTMNPAIPLNEESGLTGQTQNRTRQAFRTDRTLISLPDKEELLLLLRLNRIHRHRQKLPERHVKHTLCFSPQMVNDYEKR